MAAVRAYPEQARTLQMITPAESLEDQRCRLAYDYLVRSAHIRRPVTERGMLDHLHENMKLVEPETPGGALWRDTVAFLYRVERIPVEEYTGVKAARELPAKEIRDRLHNDHLPFGPLAPELSSHTNQLALAAAEHQPIAAPRVV